MTEDTILTEVLDREGGWRPETPRPNAPPDPATNMGITLPTLRTWRKNPALTEDDLKDLGPVEARQIYSQMYIADPGFTQANVPFEPLRVQLIDFGINSGPERAVRWLQRVMRAPVTGKMDARTIGWLQHATIEDAEFVEPLALVNDALVAARSYMIDSLEDTGKLRSADEEGVESRALSFFLAKP